MTRSLTTTRPLAAGLAALALTLGLGLSGCSLLGGPETASPSAAGSSADRDSGQSGETVPGSGEDSATAPGEDTGGEDAAGKPSREEVAAGLNDFIGGMAPGASDASQAVLDQLTECAVDKIYDSASADSLQAIADGNLGGAAPDDLNALTEAISTCGSEITGG